MYTDLQFSLSDIAHLAQVQRPVVSTWRSRHAASGAPFPRAVGTVGGEERFDVEAVVSWLEGTGRGNNPDVRGDAPAHAFPAGMSLRDDPEVFAGLTSLLCLKVISGTDLGTLSAPAVIEIAEEADPGDRLLRQELGALASRLTTLARFADLLSDAAFGPAKAFETLLARRFQYGLTAAVMSAVSPEVHDLVTATAISLARATGVDPPRYVDPSGVGSDLLMKVVLADADQAPYVFAADEASSQARLFRRRLRVHDVLIEPVRDSVASLGPAVLLAQLPLSSRPDTTGEQILDAIDEIALDMTDQQYALVLGPASALVDRPRGRSLNQLRAHVLRAGRVRAMVRLPAGLVTWRSREALALWVLGPDLGANALEDRRVAVIDVSDEPLTSLLIQEIREDIIAAVATPQLARAHSYAQARLVPTATLLVQRGALFGRVQRLACPSLEPAAAAVLVEQLRMRPAPAADALGGVSITAAEPLDAASIALGDAIRRRLIRALPGNRNGFDFRDGGNVQVFGVPELTEVVAVGSRRLDRLTFLGAYAPARLTEPGDVVFCTSPRPAALVDELGGSAAQYPARILRIDPTVASGLSPYVLASTINAQQGTSRAWWQWALSLVPVSQVQPLDLALSALAQEKAATASRLAELEELQGTLVQAVASRSIVLQTAPDLSRTPARRTTDAA